MEKNINDLNDTWIQTNSGVKFDFLNVTEEMININDIAHSLSLICRFNGHCKEFYSVAEHSYWLSRYVLDTTNDKKKAREALLHDAAEYVIADIAKPIKASLPQYRIIEKGIEKVIATKFSLDYPMENWLKALDTRMLKTEKYQVMNVTSIPWEIDVIETLPINVMFYPPKVMKELFIDQFIRVN